MAFRFCFGGSDPHLTPKGGHTMVNLLNVYQISLSNCLLSPFRGSAIAEWNLGAGVRNLAENAPTLL